MKVNDLMVNSLGDLLITCDVADVNVIHDDYGEVRKIIVEYVPTDLARDTSGSGSDKNKSKKKPSF